MRACERAQVPCGPVYSIDEIFEDPHYAARGNILRMQDPRAGNLAVPNVELATHFAVPQVCAGVGLTPRSLVFMAA